MSDDIKLLPCPFCGGSALMTEASNGFYVACEWKFTCNAAQYSHDWTKVAAANRWNNRACPPNPEASAAAKPSDA